MANDFKDLKELKIGVIGATGLVGATLTELLVAAGAKSTLYASADSAGKEVLGLSVKDAARAPEDALELVFLAAGADVSRQLVPELRASGALCVDKSTAFRLEAGVPLVVPEVNGSLARGQGLLANPNCVVIPLAVVLEPLRQLSSLKRVRLATYQSVSGAGRKALLGLAARSADELNVDADWRLLGNEVDEEAKIRDETRKVLDLPELDVSVTCLRVPVAVGHAAALWVETEEPLLSPQAALLDAPSITLAYSPNPLLARGRDDVLVGRVRQTGTELALFFACDNLRKGAALNALQVAKAALGG